MGRAEGSPLDQLDKREVDVPADGLEQALQIRDNGRHVAEDRGANQWRGQLLL